MPTPPPLLQSPRIRHVHFMGIGGIGVRGLAEILLNRGYQVSGCDPVDNPGIHRLSRLGATIADQHHTDHITQTAPDAVVYSSAIPPDHPELQSAYAQQIPCWRRGQLLAELMQTADCGIAVAGTHGKTTTTGLVNHLLTHAGLNPTCVNGGIVQGHESTVQVGDSTYFIAEADESDQSFLYLRPKIAIITNIEADHLENYADNFQQLQQTFIEFMQQVPADGALVCCLDDPILAQLLTSIEPTDFAARIITYGFHPEAMIHANHFQQQGLKCDFTWQSHDTPDSHTAYIKLPGRHNVSNTLAAIAVAHLLAIDPAIINAALPLFPGMGRRFHHHGELVIASNNGKVTVFDDYGHHPTEIAATLAAARGAWPERRIVLAFQPHRYTRTQQLMGDFVNVLRQVELLLLLEIYGAGEPPIAGISSQCLCDAISQDGHLKPILIPELTDLPQALQQWLQDGDILFLQGAGSIGKMVEQLTLLGNHI